MVVEDCGPTTFENPPQDRDAKVILLLRAMSAMERCMAAGLVHQGALFNNIVHDPETLQVRIIDVEMQPQNV